MNIENRISKLEEKILPKRRSLEGLTAFDLTDPELIEIICQDAGITEAELTEDKLDELLREELCQEYGIRNEDLTDGMVSDLCFKTHWADRGKDWKCGQCIDFTQPDWKERLKHKEFVVNPSFKVRNEPKQLALRVSIRGFLDAEGNVRRG